ncbi:hypothetical protein [Pseudomonas taeanensis]|nr:hypothetical protein [Pseudomonas taeanensis]
MPTIATDVAISRTPDITANILTPIDWVQIAGLGVTAIIVIGGIITTIYAIKNTTKTEVLSSNRQAWINTLRDELSSFISAIMGIWSIQQMQKEQWDTERFYLAVKDARRLKAKIALLFNPAECQSKLLMEQINQSFDKAMNNESSVMQLCDQIVATSQAILKTEWERVKKVE